MVCDETEKTEGPNGSSVFSKVMYFVCRGEGNNTLNIIVKGGCKKFIKYYIENNISESDLNNYIIFKAIEIPREEIMKEEE
jgi:hypothetical protein